MVAVPVLTPFTLPLFDTVGILVSELVHVTLLSSNVSGVTVAFSVNDFHNLLVRARPCHALVCQGFWIDRSFQCQCLALLNEDLCLVEFDIAVLTTFLYYYKVFPIVSSLIGSLRANRYIQSFVLSVSKDILFNGNWCLCFNSNRGQAITIKESSTPIDVTPLGMVIEVSSLHPKKALSPMVVTVNSIEPAFTFSGIATSGPGIEAV